MLNMLMLSKNNVWLSLLMYTVCKLVKDKGLSVGLKVGRDAFELWGVINVLLDVDSLVCLICCY